MVWTEQQEQLQNGLQLSIPLFNECPWSALLIISVRFVPEKAKASEHGIKCSAIIIAIIIQEIIRLIETQK